MHNYKTFKQFLTEITPETPAKIKTDDAKTLESFDIPNIFQGDFDIEQSKITSLKGGPVEVHGNFYASNCEELTSLEFGPKKVIGSFQIAFNKKVSSLQHCPTKITEDLICNASGLTSLQFSPKKVTGDLRAFLCQLRNLEGCPEEITGALLLGANENLSSLKGSPVSTGNYNISSCKSITSLEGITTKINGHLSLYHCTGLTSLQGIHKIFKGGYVNANIDLTGSKIQSHLLGLLLIQGLTRVECQQQDDFYGAVQIINKHLAGDRDVIDCQQELIEAGLKEYAQL